MKEVGEYRDFIDCTSRGSGKNVEEFEPNGHRFCVECLPWPEQKRVGFWKELSENDKLLAKGKYVVFDYIGLPNEKHGVWKYYDNKQQLKELVYFDKGEILKKVIPGKLENDIDYEELKAWFEFRKPKSIDIHDFFVLESIRTKNHDLFKNLEKVGLVDSEILKFLEDQGMLSRRGNSVKIMNVEVSDEYLIKYSKNIK